MAEHIQRHDSHNGHGHAGHQCQQEHLSLAQSGMNMDTSVSFTEQNRSHWNEFASKYTAQKWQKDMINQITDFILTNVNWIGVDFVDPSSSFEKSGGDGKKVRVLDYACGPGTVTSALGDRATEYVGLDLSENMVKAYNARFSPEESSNQTAAHAVVGNLLDESSTNESLAGKEFFDFDLAVVGLGFHHFENIELATRQLAARLKSGGVFLIVDFMEHSIDDNHDGKHPAAHTVAHAGFSDEKIQKVFQDAGLVDVSTVQMDGEVLMHGLNPRKAFMARGRKP